jgi:stage II sporulation protein D
VSYFFSTSGGYTEDVENAFEGSAAQPWLRGVDDPYDNSSPYHRWGPYSYSERGFADKLGDWVKGRFESLDVLQRGVSPRIVWAEVRGTRGNTDVTGAQLRSRLGLRDTWFYLRRVSSTTTSGMRARTVTGSSPTTAISGSVSSTRDRFVTLQRQVKDRWVKVVDVPLEGDRYEIHVRDGGAYRIVSGWAAGPVLHVSP